MGNYSSGDVAALPGTSADLSHIYDATDRTNVGTDDTNYVDQTGSSGYELHQYKDSITATSASVTWKGKSSLAPSSSKVQLQVYNVTGTAWEDVSGAGASNNVAAADTDFTLSGTIATADYMDSGVITFRIYQSSVTGVQLGTEILTDGNMEAVGVVNWPLYNTGITAKNTTTPINGTQDLYITAAITDDGGYQYLGLTSGKWYRTQATIKVSSGNIKFFLYDDANEVIVAALNVGSGAGTVTYKGSGICRHTEVNYSRIFFRSFSGTGAYYVDDASVKEITKSSLFTQQDNLGSANVTVSAAITCPNTYEDPAGVAICMDANDPSKYILGVVHRTWGYIDAVRVYLIDGTSVTISYDAPIGSGATYGAGKVVKLVNNSNALDIYYDNVKQNTDSINTSGYTGTICAAFNTDDDNTLSSFSADTP